MGPTDPNRYHMFSGSVGNDGSSGPDGDPVTGHGPVITNAELGYGWSTYPERLQRAGISWKVYQDSGVGLTADGFWGWTSDPFIGNYGDNSLLYFHQYQNAPDSSPLAMRARPGRRSTTQLNRDPNRLFDIFSEDVRTENAAAGLVHRRTRGLHGASRTGRRTGAPGTSRSSWTSSSTIRSCGARQRSSSTTTKRAGSSITWCRRHRR